MLIGYALYLVRYCFQDTSAGGIILSPFVKVMGLYSIPTYLFWYSLGALVFPKLKLWSEVIIGDGTRNIKYIIYNIVGVLLTCTTALIFMLKPDYFWNKLNVIFGKLPNLVYQNFKVLTAFVICLTFMYLSIYLRHSAFLIEIGQNTLILMGFESIVKNFLALNLIPMFVGIPKIETTVQVIIISMMTILIARLLFKPLNKHVPFLVGK